MGDLKSETKKNKISQASGEDVNEIFSLWKKIIEMHSAIHPVFCVKKESETLIKSDIARMISGDTSTILKVENVTGKISGFTFLKIIQKPKTFEFSECGYIGETFVDDDFRSKGVGAELIKAAEEWFGSKGVKCIEMQVAVKNPRGKKFWKNAGFEETTVHMTKFI